MGSSPGSGRMVAWILTRKHREHHDIEPCSILFPVGSEHALSAKADSFGHSQRGDVVLRHEHLKAADVKRRDAPIDQQAKCFGCEATAAGARNHSASVFASVMFAHHDHNFTQVRITPKLSDSEMEQFTIGAVLLEQFHDTDGVNSWKGRH